MKYDEADLTPDLRHLEEQLRLTRRDPADALRAQVLASVRVELAQRSADLRWRFAAAAAAGILLWFNLSLSATARMDFQADTEPRLSRAEMQAEVQQLLPELPPDELACYSDILYARLCLTPHPRDLRIGFVR